MNSNSAKLKSLLGTRPMLIDGGLASLLESRGKDIGGVLWSAMLLKSDPEAIVSAHRAFLDAGADIVVSASYQASRAGFHQVGVGADEADELIASSVDLARKACDAFAAANPERASPWVAASIGPYGAVLNDGSEYRGNYGVPAVVLRLFHEQRLQLLDNSGADILACETIPSIEEATVLAELLRESKTPALVAFSCRNAREICDGTPISDAASLFADHPQVAAVGVNCTAPQYVVPLIADIRRAAPDKAIVVYPNSGEVYDAASKSWSGVATPAASRKDATEWLEAGASIIGGCCRIGPAHIAAMRDALRSS